VSLPLTKRVVSTDILVQHLGTTKPASATVAAYRRDVVGVARRMAAPDDVGVLRLEDLSKGALRAAFSSWASDHAAASVLRAHSAWSRFFDFLVAEDLWEGNPMAAVAKPKRPKGVPRAIRHPDAAARLLATAAVADPEARAPWPERDLALVATLRHRDPRRRSGGLGHGLARRATRRPPPLDRGQGSAGP